MPCAHGLVPVGMMNVNSTPKENLESDLTEIYLGDTNYSFEACNAVHSYQRFDYPAANKAQRAINQYGDLVERAAAASGNRLKCLVGDLTQKGNFESGLRVDYFYDGPADGAIVNTCNVRAFVNGFIDRINAQGLVDNVLGWYLADEPFMFDGTANKPSIMEFADICKAAHETQTARGWDKPFYVVFYTNPVGFWKPNGNDIDFSRMDPWVRKVTLPEPDGADANMVIMIDYYPWSEIAVEGNFLFHQLPSEEIV